MMKRLLLPVAIATLALAGLTLVPAWAERAMNAIACSTAAACFGATNSTSGPAISGTSNAGNGVVGITKAPSRTAKSGYGLAGYDSSTDGGTGNVAIYGNSRHGTGVQGVSNYGMGTVGTSFLGNGLAGFTIDSSGKATGQAAVLGADEDSGNGNFGGSFTSFGGAGLYANTLSANVALEAILANANNGAYLFRGTSNGVTEAAIDNNGNVVIHGEIRTAGSCSSGCARHRGVQSYGATSAAPTLEDTGEAQTRGGSAFVPIDEAFARAIDARRGYVVLLTPEGDTHGLFVARRTPSGFLVSEISGGRGNVPFAYRIVAHPYGNADRRLPLVER